MSVLVKGMRMPKSCGECFFYDDGGCFVTMNIVLLKRDEYKPKWCPLVEITEDEENWLDGMNTFYCDRNICASNEVNGVSCEECEIAKYHNLEDDDSPCLNCGAE